MGAEIELARLEGENAELSDRLESRTVIERAKGILQRSLGISEAGADLILQEESRKTSKNIGEVAIDKRDHHFGFGIAETNVELYHTRAAIRDHQTYI